jgi:predicted esterase
MPPQGQLQYFRSSVDGRLHPCAVCATDDGSEPKALLVEVSPGALDHLSGAVALTEEIASIAAQKGRSCVVLRPTGRGGGSVYQNYGEVDVLEAIEHVAAHYAIDRDRISISGSSMGGAAVWYLISHYPDLFAAAAPFCGYCDYRLWEKPGGLTFHMHLWEEPSWRARSAAFLVENIRHTPLWIVHGEWDRAAGGGVSVEHSRQMARLLGEKDYSHTYTEVPRTGHGCRRPEIWKQVIPWLLDQRKERRPRQVSLATYTLRHNRAYWVTIEQLEIYGERGSVEAVLAEGDALDVATKEVRVVSLGPIPHCTALALTIDGQALGSLDLSGQQTFQRGADGAWQAGGVDLSAQKRHAASGPLGDLFHEGLLLVPGTAGSDEETFFNQWIADNARGYYASRNGGVHRGGIMGHNAVELSSVADGELDEERLAANNLLLYGNGASNSVLARFAEGLPLRFADDRIDLAGKTYAEPGVAVFAAFPHPLHPERYLAVHGGTAPDAICWGSHLDMQLLPDYLVYAGGDVLDWGFWDNEWR